MLVEHAAETPGVHKHLDKALNETRELHKSLRDEEAALREKKKESKLGNPAIPVMMRRKGGQIF